MKLQRWHTCNSFNVAISEKRRRFAVKEQKKRRTAVSTHHTLTHAPPSSFSFLKIWFTSSINEGRQYRLHKEQRVTFTSKCLYTVWPATLIGDQKPQLSTTSFELAPETSNSLDVPSPWSGRIWARTGCSGDSGRFTCTTGDCTSGQVGCIGIGAISPWLLPTLVTLRWNTTCFSGGRLIEGH